MTDVDLTTDVLVAGTGAAGMAAAMTAADLGLDVLMVESTDRWGGSSAMSGGGMWLPANPLMAREGAGDSRKEALTYLEATVGDAGPSTTRAHKEAFVDGVGDFVTLAERLGIEFARAADYPDYYPERPGGKIGRALEVRPFDAKRIGEWWDTARAQQGVAYPVMTDDVWLLGRAWSTPGGMARGARFVGRALAGAVRREKLVGAGAALACAFLDVLLRQGVQLWLSAPVEELLLDEGRVVGAVVQRDGRPQRIRATRGVVLAAGGFAHRADWRQAHHGVPADWTSANPGNVGSAIEVGMRVGAAVALMDDAWWGASTAPTASSGPSFLVSERSMPFSIIVDGNGERFANESESYVDLGHRMLERRRTAGEAFWMISDARHTRRYLRTFALMPGVTKAMRAEGSLQTARTIGDLASAIGVDPGRLHDTVQRFNGFARSGIDQDFGRGNSAYDRYYSDPLVRPNPNLGPLERPPFTAVRLVIGDLGTKGGLLTDPDAQVVREDGSPIEGLYAAGNTAASVMGRTYPGPGSTIGPAVVFGMRAARHLAGVRV